VGERLLKTTKVEQLDNDNAASVAKSQMVKSFAKTKMKNILKKPRTIK
jgi:hypothetical protein